MTEKRNKNGRGKDGRFLPGNKGGGRKPTPKEFKDLAESSSVEALETVINILRDPEAKHSDKIKAAEVILDRAYGKAKQSMDLEANVETQLGLVILPEQREDPALVEDSVGT